jgi:hypothetical protein
LDAPVVAHGYFDETPPMTFVLRLLLLVTCFLLPFAAQSAAPLVDPAPVPIPSGLDAETVRKEITRSLIGRSWVVSAEQPGEIEATLHLRKHVARVAVSYDEHEVRLAYVSSERLDYKVSRGQRRIHKNYLNWIRYVMTDISNNLQIAALK